MLLRRSHLELDEHLSFFCKANNLGISRLIWGSLKTSVSTGKTESWQLVDQTNPIREKTGSRTGAWLILLQLLRIASPYCLFFSPRSPPGNINQCPRQPDCTSGGRFPKWHTTSTALQQSSSVRPHRQRKRTSEFWFAFHLFQANSILMSTPSLMSNVRSASIFSI